MLSHVSELSGASGPDRLLRALYKITCTPPGLTLVKQETPDWLGLLASGSILSIFSLLMSGQFSAHLQREPMWIFCCCFFVLFFVEKMTAVLRANL